MSMSKKIMIGIGVFIAFIIVIISIAFHASSGLTDTIKNQLTALRAGDLNAAYTYTSSDFQKTTVPSTFKLFIDQYPSLKENASVSFNKRVIEKGIGIVSGTLTAKDGAVTPIEFRLVKENGVWKILAIKVQSTGLKEDAEAFTKLPNSYTYGKNKYSIKYPASWVYEAPNGAAVVLSGKKGTTAFYSTVNVQAILTKKTGGKYSSSQELMAALKEQVKAAFNNVKFIDEGSLSLSQPNGSKIKAESLVFTYDMKDQPFKQWQLVILRSDNDALYTWGYTSPVKIYDTYLPIAKAMLASWVIL